MFEYCRKRLRLRDYWWWHQTTCREQIDLVKWSECQDYCCRELNQPNLQSRKKWFAEWKSLLQKTRASKAALAAQEAAIAASKGWIGKSRAELQEADKGQYSSNRENWLKFQVEIRLWNSSSYWSNYWKRLAQQMALQSNITTLKATSLPMQNRLGKSHSTIDCKLPGWI